MFQALKLRFLATSVVFDLALRLIVWTSHAYLGAASRRGLWSGRAQNWFGQAVLARRFGAFFCLWRESRAQRRRDAAAHSKQRRARGDSGGAAGGCGRRQGKSARSGVA
eukprot:4733722-Pleurochrysis_carterae.AAC.1